MSSNHRKRGKGERKTRHIVFARERAWQNILDSPDEVTLKRGARIGAALGLQVVGIANNAPHAPRRLLRVLHLAAQQSVEARYTGVYPEPTTETDTGPYIPFAYRDLAAQLMNDTVEVQT